MTLTKVLCIAVLICAATALENGLARTPQMGWNSWNHYGCNVNQDVILDTARALVSTGLAKKGYVYVNIDDCWQIARDPNTHEIIADPATFPNGIPWLSDQVHQLGLKFGLYSDAGTYTCQKRPGSLGYEQIDAQTYAKWNVDYLKYDNCYNEDISPQKRYPVMRDALNATGRDIFYSMCEWGQDKVWTWASPVGNSWRTTGDISDNWNSFVSILDQNEPLWQYAAPGGWNDPDMLEVGNGGMTFDEYYAEFSLWALMKAPLIIGCDVTNMDSKTLEILSNEEIIAINQDPLGIQGKRISRDRTPTSWTEVWSGPLVDGAAVILFNRGDKKHNVQFTFEQIGWSGRANIRDLISHQDLGSFSTSFSADVERHAVMVLKLTRAVAEEKPQVQTFLG